MKRWNRLICAALLTAIHIVTPMTVSSAEVYSNATSEYWSEGPSISAEAAVVMEASTGTVLYEKNATEALYPASTTKVMTALLAIENAKMDDMVTFSETAIQGVGKGGSHIGIIAGEEISLENCLYGLLMASGNEVACALAEHVSGSIDGFVNLMNQEAETLGCVNTHFANANGFHDDNHYTCAYDLALIAKRASKSKVFRKIIGTKTYVIPATNLMEERPLANSNQMLTGAQNQNFKYADCFGGKTGYTGEAKYTLVTYAKHNNMELICVILKAESTENRYEDAGNLFDYAFERYSMYGIDSLNTAIISDNANLFTKFAPLFDIERSPLSVDTSAKVVLPNNADFSEITQSVEYLPLAELTPGENIIGTVTLTYGGKNIGTTNIIYYSENYYEIPEEPTEPVEAPPKDTTVRDTVLAIVGVLSGIFLMVHLIHYIRVERPRRKRRKAYYEKRKKKKAGSNSNYIDY